jgi:DoxX-like family
MKNKKTVKIMFWIVTGLMSAMLLMGVSMYILKTDEMKLQFLSLGFPAFLIYILMVAKPLALIAIWTNKIKSIAEWAYAGLTFNLLLAVAAHLNVEDGEQYGAIMVLVLLAISYFLYKKKESLAD